MFARFSHETGLREDAGHLETEAPQGAPGAGSQGPPSNLFAPILEQWDLPQNIRTALSNAPELDGSELVDDMKAITYFGSPFPRLPREADARSVQP